MPTFLQNLSALLLCLALGITACEPDSSTETDNFQKAEALYRTGQYDKATKLYSDFVLQYPRSPFTRTAKLRLKTIDREIAAVMGAQGGNRPIYTRPNEAAAGSGDPARPEVPLADDPSTED